MTREVFVVEQTMVVDEDGTEETFLFSSEPWATGPTDVPPHTPVRGLLRNAGTLKRELFTEARMTGAIRAAWGNIVYANPAPDPDGPGELDHWLDYGLSGGRVIVRRGVIGTQYPSEWAIVYIAYATAAIVDSSSVTIRLRDRLQMLDSPVVTAGFDGSGGIEGSGSVAKPKQFVNKAPGFIIPILVDRVRQIYYVQSTGTDSHDEWRINTGVAINFFDVFENGVEITRGASTYSTTADLLATAPASGEVRYYFGPASTYIPSWRNGPVLFRLGTPPVGELRVYARGQPTDADHARYGRAAGSLLFSHLALRAGVDRASIDDSNDISLGAVLVDDDETYQSLMVKACKDTQSWFGFTRLDQFRSGALLDPESIIPYYGVDPALVGDTSTRPSSSAYTFTPDRFQDLRREPVPGMEAPVWSLFVKAQRTWPCPVNEGASDEMKDYLTRDPWWATFQGVSDTCKTANPGAVVANVEVENADFPNEQSRRLFLERYFVLYGGRRDLFTFTTKMTAATLALELHDVVTLQSPRFGLSAGRKFRVVSMLIDCSDQGNPRIRFGVWGGQIGDYTGTISLVHIGAVQQPAFQPGRRVFGAFTRFGYGLTSGAGAAIALRSFAAFARAAVGIAGVFDASFASVQLLLHGDNNFTDSSAAARTATQVGSISTEADSGAFGGYAIRAIKGGTANYLEYTAGGGFLSSTSQDFTFEAWVQIIDYSTGPNGYTDGRCSIVRMTNGGSKVFELSGASGSSSLVVMGGVSCSITAFARFHVAISRVSGTMNKYINGVRQVSGTDNFNFDTLRIGNAFTDATNTCGVRLEEVRLTVGVGRYTGASFTVPTAAFPDA